MDAPRFRVLEDDLQRVAFERGVSLRALSELAGLGHQVMPPAETSGGFGGGQIITIDRENGAMFGGSDPRKDGCAVRF